MNSSYLRLAQTYSRYVRRLSPSTGAVLDDIKNLHGAQAAYWVAFIIVVSKDSLEQHGTLDNNSHYKHFLDAWPQVFPLAERAFQRFIADRYQITDDDETQPTEVDNNNDMASLP
jgi:hypothetical protein